MKANLLGALFDHQKEKDEASLHCKRLSHDGMATRTWHTLWSGEVWEHPVGRMQKSIPHLSAVRRLPCTFATVLTLSRIHRNFASSCSIRYEHESSGSWQQVLLPPGSECGYLCSNSTWGKNRVQYGAMHSKHFSKSVQCQRSFNGPCRTPRGGSGQSLQ